MNLPNGTLLQGGKYRIERVLGQGGFGITYLATHTALGSRVAIKEYFDSKVNSRGCDGKAVTVSLETNREAFDAQRTKFRKEAQRMQSLVCEHIAKVWDFFDENCTSYYVMEYIDGGSLEQRLRQHGSLSESEVRDVLDQMLDALQAIHTRRMWHLDIKPGNIMCAAAGRLKLIDFGASKLMNPGNPTTTSSAIALSPGFAPLEQMAGDLSSFGPWTDFYALGATLYVLLTGNRPPMPNHIMANGVSAFSYPTHISQQMRTLIQWMMEPNINDRPRSVAAIRNHLQQPFVATYTEQTAPSGLTPPPPTPASSSSPWGWIVAVALAAILLGFAMRSCNGTADSTADEPFTEKTKPETDSMAYSAKNESVSEIKQYDELEARDFVANFYDRYTQLILNNNNQQAESFLKSNATNEFYKRYLRSGRGEFGEPADIVTGESDLLYNFKYEGVSAKGTYCFVVLLSYEGEGDERRELSNVEVYVKWQNGKYLIDKTKGEWF